MSIDMWDTRYNTDDYVFGTQPNIFVQNCADYLQKAQTVLDVACGEGRNSVWLAEQGLDVTSVDGSAVALDKAQKLAQARGVKLNTLQCNLLNHSWPDGVFDIVLGVFIQFAGPEQRVALFKNMQNAVKKGGLILLHGYQPHQVDYGTGGPPNRENMYTKELLTRSFTGWTIHRLNAYEKNITEGTGHNGKSALIDLVAQKPC